MKGRASMDEERCIRNSGGSIMQINQKLRSAWEKSIPLTEDTVVAGESAYLSHSMSISEPARQGWLRISEALILSLGLTLSILRSKSRAQQSTDLYIGPLMLNFIFLLFSQTQSHFLPSKRGRRTSKMWKIAPREKMSHSGSICFPLVSEVTSGATQPGVPHLQKMQSSQSASAERPKSAMTGTSPVSPLSIMFSGLMSLCIILYSCISLSPTAIPLMNCLISVAVKIAYLSLMRLWSWPSESSQRTMQMEFSDSKTPSHLMMLGQSKVLSIWISLRRFSLWLGSEDFKVDCLENALAAKCFLSVTRSTSQTVAKPPFPIFLIGLQFLWKPYWLRC